MSVLRHDSIQARDGEADLQISCGTEEPEGGDFDSAIVDAVGVDVVDSDCEDISRPGAPQTTIDSGPSGLTSDSTPTFGFSSDQPASTFECRVDSGSFTSCTSTHTTASLTDGAHTFEVRATAGGQTIRRRHSAASRSTRPRPTPT